MVGGSDGGGEESSETETETESELEADERMEVVEGRSARRRPTREHGRRTRFRREDDGSQFDRG